MANGISPKFTTTNNATYQNPHRDQTDFKYYHPQLFVNCESQDRVHGKPTTHWFQDYRRSCIAERTLKKNLMLLNSPMRPSCYSEKPDIALGARKQSHEALFPGIHNQPQYLLSNRNPDRMRDRDSAFMRDTLNHRNQYCDETGSNHKKVDRFYYPYQANDTFKKRDLDLTRVTDNPTTHVSAVELVYDRRRADPVVQHRETDVSM